MLERRGEEISPPKVTHALEKSGELNQSLPQMIGLKFRTLGKITNFLCESSTAKAAEVNSGCYMEKGAEILSCWGLILLGKPWAGCRANTPSTPTLASSKAALRRADPTDKRNDIPSTNKQPRSQCGKEKSSTFSRSALPAVASRAPRS